VPLVSYGDPCVHHKLAVKALQDAGKDWEVVFTGTSMNSLNGAVAAGLGVLAITRRRAQQTGMHAWDDGPLPKLPELYRGVYVREGGAAAVYEQLAEDISAVLRGATGNAPKKRASFGLMLNEDSAA
jgi:DNA-binding transcriptional LysR family regulator